MANNKTDYWTNINVQIINYIYIHIDYYPNGNRIKITIAVRNIS